MLVLIKRNSGLALPVRGRIVVVLFVLSFLTAQTLAQDFIRKRFKAPAGFQRVPAPQGSFAQWLRQLPLQAPGSPVLDFRGKIFKQGNDSTVAAVVDMNIKGRRLEQCMDVLLRFYADYLIAKGKRDSLQFPLPDGLTLSWKQWRAGFRPYFKGLHFRLRQSENPDSSANSYRRYLNTIFSYSGSQTFYHFYPRVALADIQIGDFIVRKERKGHAVLIVDMVENKQGRKMALVGQGDTPACAFYLLKRKDGSPWFSLDSAKEYLNLPIKKKMFWRGLRRFPSFGN